MGELFIFAEIANSFVRRYMMAGVRLFGTVSFGGVDAVQDGGRYIQLGSQSAFILLERVSDQELSCTVYVRNETDASDRLVRGFLLDVIDVSTYVPEVELWITFTNGEGVHSWLEGKAVVFIFI